MDYADTSRPVIVTYGCKYYKHKDGEYYLQLNSGRNVQISSEDYLNAVVHLLKSLRLIKDDKSKDDTPKDEKVLDDQSKNNNPKFIESN